LKNFRSSAMLSSYWAKRAGAARAVLPGAAACAAIAVAAYGLEIAEAHLFGRAWLEALVLAILLGTAVRTVLEPSASWSPGIRFSVKTLLEVAVVLLGASISAQVLAASGAGLLLGIATIVLVAIGASYGIGRLLGLSPKLATLVACGNSICGNSAIAAVAPVIGATGKDVAAAIAFTAVLGVIVVLALPLAMPVLGLSGLQYGVLAGLTVYAVPQVLAATAPAGAAAVQLGTLVKLVRVLMLGPVVLIVSLLAARQLGARGQKVTMPIHRLVPWFIVGFLCLATFRSFGMIPVGAIGPTGTVATLLTVVSMAALGLTTDLRTVARAGGRVIAAVTLSLLLLGLFSCVLIRLLHLA
jgi:uncharacterized integral membrane protein (TIGR00698 family)